jgi:methionine-rich copper-binding protein CopC
VASPYNAAYTWSSGSASGSQTVTARNNAGMQSSASFTVTPDTSGPTGQSVDLVGGPYYNALSIALSLDAGGDGGSGVDATSGLVERESATLSNGSCVSWSGSWTAVTLTGGADTSVATNKCYRYRYSIADNVGNVSTPSSVSAAAKVDATLPVTSDDAPAGWRNSAVTVTLTVNETGSGIASTLHRVDGGTFQNGTTIVIPGPADHSNDGVHMIEYRSTDVAGNVEALRSATVRIDTELPSGSVSAPAGGAHVNGIVPVSASAADAQSGVKSVTFLVRPSGAGSFSTISTDTAAPYEASWDSTAVAEGDADLKVVVADAAGNAVTSALVTVVVDNPPAPTLGDPGANLSGTVTLHASSPADTAQVVFERAPAGSGAWAPIATDTTAPYEASFDTQTVADERYDFRAVATDLGGFIGASPLQSARVDNTVPSVSLSDPGNGTLVGGPNVHLGALASDLGSGVASVRFEGRSAGGPAFAEIGTDTAAPFEATWNTSALAGSYELRAVAIDAAGNPAASITVLVTIDSTAPSVTLGDPGPAVRGVLSLSASTQGAAVAKVAFARKRSGGDEWMAIATDADAPWGAALDTRQLSDGLYDLRAQATDANGTVLATHTREGVRVDNTAPAVVSTSPANGARVDSATNLVLVVSEAVTVQAATFDGAGISPEVSGTHITFATGSLGGGAHELSGTLEDAVGNSAPFRLRFTIEVEAHVTLALAVNRPSSSAHGKQQLFVVPITLSAPATVETTLLSPTGRRLETVRTRLGAGRQAVRMTIPRASLPPGRYTIVVRATSADGTQVVQRVHVTIAAKPAKKPKRSLNLRAVVAAAPGKSDGEPPTPSAHRLVSPRPDRPAAGSPTRPAPAGTTQTDRKPLEVASSIAGARHKRSIGLVMILLSMGSAVGFLIMTELQRMFPAPRRLA